MIEIRWQKSGTKRSETKSTPVFKAETKHLYLIKNSVKHKFIDCYQRDMVKIQRKSPERTETSEKVDKKNFRSDVALVTVFSAMSVFTWTPQSPIRNITGAA
jgi:hypothetical protein